MEKFLKRLQFFASGSPVFFIFRGGAKFRAREIYISLVKSELEVTKQMNQFRAFDIENNSGIIDAFDKQTSKNNSRAAVALVSIYLQYSLYKEMYFDIVF